MSSSVSCSYSNCFNFSQFSRFSQNSSGVTEESLKYLSTDERSIFSVIFSTILTVALLGNISAIFVTAQRCVVIAFNIVRKM